MSLNVDFLNVLCLSDKYFLKNPLGCLLSDPFYFIVSVISFDFGDRRYGCSNLYWIEDLSNCILECDFRINKSRITDYIV